MKKKKMAKKMSANVFTVALQLRKEERLDSYRLDWPREIQNAAFCVLTHDEITRFPDLRDFLRKQFLKKDTPYIPVTVTLCIVTENKSDGEPAKCDMETCNEVRTVPDLSTPGLVPGGPEGDPLYASEVESAG